MTELPRTDKPSNNSSSALSVGLEDWRGRLRAEFLRRFGGTFGRGRCAHHYCYNGRHCKDASPETPVEWCDWCLSYKFSESLLTSAPLQEQRQDEGLLVDDVQSSLLHPAHQVYFRAGLIACREYMARFVEAQDPNIAMSIRANWWPSLGKDYGPPRQLDFGEVTTGEFGTPEFRCLTATEVSPTQEALPIALAFLEPSETAPIRSEQEPAPLSVRLEKIIGWGKPMNDDEIVARVERLWCRAENAEAELQLQPPQSDLRARLEARANSLLGTIERCKHDRTEADNENEKAGERTAFGDEPCESCDENKADAALLREAAQALSKAEQEPAPTSPLNLTWFWLGGHCQRCALKIYGARDASGTLYKECGCERRGVGR